MRMCATFSLSQSCLPPTTLARFSHQLPLISNAENDENVCHILPLAEFKISLPPRGRGTAVAVEGAYVYFGNNFTPKSRNSSSVIHYTYVTSLPLGGG